MPARIPRYSDRAFPAYAFVPGQGPHPTRDPDGHSYGRHTDKLDAFSADEWLDSDTYRYGIDLFNHGYWWEAHEALEAVWMAAGRQSPTGQYVQGLIQIAVAHLKRRQGFYDVAQRMALEGLERMRVRQARFLGMDVAGFRAAVLDSFARPDGEDVKIELVPDAA